MSLTTDAMSLTTDAMYSMKNVVSSNKDLHSVLFGGKVAADTQLVTFLMLLLLGLYSGARSSITNVFPRLAVDGDCTDI